MKAMVLAAGLGTRLRPLTNDRPKALVEVGGRTLLEIALRRLQSFGVDEAIVNTHHYAEMVAEYLQAHRNFGMRIEISHETELLDTGGGLKKAAWFFLEDPDADFILHNVDVLSTIDLGSMVEFHRANAALATLAVQDRASSRPLLFDASGRLRGRGSQSPVPKGEGPGAPGGGEAGVERVERVKEVEALAFAGIHVLSPRIFALLDEEGAFSIIDGYVRLSARGAKILGFRADGAYWRDLGRPESIAQASADITSGALSRGLEAIS
jgi:NDP-sugar pyrophosphorylase family protein